jgi:hypothetical protein
MIIPLQGASATNLIQSTIQRFRTPLQNLDIFMSVSSDRNVGSFLKLHTIFPGFRTPIEMWFQAVKDTRTGKHVFQSYRNFTMFRTFPIFSLLRNGYPMFKETNNQQVFRTCLQALHAVGFYGMISDWNLLVEANEYRRYAPEYHDAALVLRERIYP